MCLGTEIRCVGRSGPGFGTSRGSRQEVGEQRLLVQDTEGVR